MASVVNKLVTNDDEAYDGETVNANYSYFFTKEL